MVASKRKTAFKKKADLWKILALVLGGILISNTFFDINLSVTPKGKSDSPDSSVNESVQAAIVMPTEIYKKLVCSCCGKSIADCSCGMAQERKAFVDEQVSKGLDERGVFRAAIKEYGEEILFDTAMAAEIKEELVAEAPKDRAIIVVEPESVDLGDVSMAKGEAETVFQVKNAGRSDLIISGMETSCMCTTVVLEIGGETSPVFGMHDNPTDWTAALGPGAEGRLVVTFDPNAHGPEAVGPVTRTVSIQTNDPIDSFKKVQLDANVTK